MTESSVQFTSEEITQFEARDAELFRQLDAIGKKPVTPIEAEVEAPAPVVTPYVAPNLSPDLSDPDVIQEVIRLTRFDKALQRHRDLRQKLDALEALPEPTDQDRKRILATQISLDGAERAMQRAQDDLARQRDNIDEWRAGPGREERNEKRRNVRTTPNTDRATLKAMTEAERKLYDQDRRSDANWKKARKDWPAEKLQAAYAVRLQDRDERRKKKASIDAEAVEIERQDAVMRENPTFGMF